MIGVSERRPSNAPAIISQSVASSPSFAPPPFFRLKRWIDVVGSLVLIVLFFPVLVLAGLLVLLDVGPPIFFWQERLGWKGRSFLIYKFRTLGAPFDSDRTPDAWVADNLQRLVDFYGRRVLMSCHNC